MAASSQRVVVYQTAQGDKRAYCTVYGGQEEAEHLMSQCRLRNPYAQDVHVLDSKVAYDGGWHYG